MKPQLRVPRPAEREVLSAFIPGETARAGWSRRSGSCSGPRPTSRPSANGAPTMRAAIYARVSTDRRNRDQTIDSQLTALRRWVADHGHGLRPGHEFADDGYSGARLDRPALDRLRDAVHQGAVEVVAVYAPDRLARQYAYQALPLG